MTNQKFGLIENTELQEIEQEFSELSLDMQGNTNSILIKPAEMKTKIQTYLNSLENISRKLDFMKKSNTDSKSYKKMMELEKNIIVLRNQLELNLKLLKTI